MGEYWQSIHGQKLGKGSLKASSSKEARELLNFSQNQLQIIIGHYHLKEHVHKLGLVNGPSVTDD
jgi:hypothetical protein